jgi:hypothetical protein
MPSNIFYRLIRKLKNLSFKRQTHSLSKASIYFHCKDRNNKTNKPLISGFFLKVLLKQSFLLLYGMGKKQGSRKKKGNLNPDEELRKLGERMTKLRKEAGYTNADLFAYDNDIHRSQYGRYEKGSDLRFSSLVKILNGYGMTLKEFFSEGFD